MVPSLENLFDDIMTYAQHGGPAVETGELRLEKLLAEMLGRQEWLELYSDDRKLFMDHDRTEFELFNREPFSELEIEKLTAAFEENDWTVRETLIGLYGNLSWAYRINADVERQLDAQGIKAPAHLGSLEERMQQWFTKAERCAEKALDALGITPKETLFLPAGRYDRTLFMLFWNLAIVKYALNKRGECRYYLEFCLRNRPWEPNIAELWEDARKIYLDLNTAA